jgi:hypothetical protein
MRVRDAGTLAVALREEKCQGGSAPCTSGLINRPAIWSSHVDKPPHLLVSCRKINVRINSGFASLRGGAIYGKARLFNICACMHLVYPRWGR